MLVILLFELLHHVASSDIPRDFNYMTRTIASCPDEGYFFKRDSSPNAIDPMCYLCFCQDNSTAICWKRQNNRCDLKYHNFVRRENRVRRSPLSLGDVLVRDAAREFFNRQSPEQCKPYESSFSDGCPPADWCIGCTVCDCDANGRWDCHVLSFCPDKNGKKQMKKQRRGSLQRSYAGRRHSKKSTAKAALTTKKPAKKPTRKDFNDQHKKKQVTQTSGINKRTINPVKGTKTKKYIPTKKSKLRAKGESNVKEVTGKPLFIKKPVPTNKSVNTKPSRGKPKTNKNSTVEVAQRVVKQFMTTMQKMMKNIERKTNSTSRQVSDKIVKKRSMQESKKVAKDLDNRPKFVAKPSPPGKVGKVNRKNGGKRITARPRTNTRRKKRQVNIPDNALYINDSKLNFNGATENGTEKGPILLDSFKNLSTVTNSPRDVLTLEPIRFQTNREVYITDNKVYEEHNSITQKIFYYNINNFTTAYQKINNITTSAPSLLYNRGNAISDYQNHSINENMEVTSTRNNDLITKSTQITKNETQAKQKQRFGNNESIIYDRYANITKFFNKESDKGKNNIEHTCKFRTLLQTLLGIHEKNIDPFPKKPTKPKRFTVLSKIKRLFRKIFSKNSKRKFYDTESVQFDGYNIERRNKNETEHLKLEPKLKIKLRNRIIELRNESDNILKTVRIIKGLLHILELKTNETRVNDGFHNSSETMKKLNLILKETFHMAESPKNLNNDQRTQINYIKDNVKVFIKSIGKFAAILDDVIQIVLSHNKNHSKIISTTMRSNSNIKSIHKFVEDNTHNTTEEKIKKLKELMINYNILQNKFIYQIYSILNNLEGVVTTKTNLKMNGDMSDRLNETDAIETNSANIIRNIRKLKALADKLNINGRRKREAMGDEDAIEYLLILMEYLLKRHAPTNPPVNDGIDLLIEAIKSAPDIKPIKKKVLEYNPMKTAVTRTASPIESYHYNSNHSKWDARRKGERNITTDNFSIKKSNQTQFDSDDDDDEDSIEEFYHKFKSFNDTSSEKIGDNVVDSNVVSATTESYTENITPTRKGNSKISKFKPLDENFSEEVITTYRDVSVELRTTTDYPTTTNNAINKKTRHFGHEDATPKEDKLLVDKKGNIDWIEENFKDISKLREVEVSLSTPKTLSVTRTRKSKFKNTDNLSDISNDIVSKKINKLNVEDAITNKQMDLLNSLDYIVDKDIDDESDSKEDKFADSYLA